jgi:hypothetical protein
VEEEEHIGHEHSIISIPIPIHGNSARQLAPPPPCSSSSTSTLASSSKLDGKLPTGSRVAATHRGWLTVYKRLFAAVFAVNVGCFVASLCGRLAADPALVSVANVLVLVLCRSELFLRLLFAAAVAVLRRGLPFAPLRNGCTAVLSSLGGVHSGCGAASVLWLAYAVARIFQRPADGDDAAARWAERCVAAATLGLLAATCAAAFPALRHLHHDAFERVHRLAGWAALAGVWLYALLLSAGGREPRDGSFALRGPRLLRSPAVWLTAAVTLLVALPWLSVRRVPVRRSPCTAASVSVLHFFSAAPARPGLLVRISRSPLSEWHAFGTVSDGVHGFSVVAGAVGDFTRRLVDDPPQHLWVRTLHFAGIPYLTHMYERALHVATGSGVGVFLSFLLQESTTEVHFLWVVKSVEKTYGDEFMELTRRCPPERLTVYDTATMGGRPDVGAMAVEAATRIGAQVVIVTSNPAGSKAVVDACNASGFAAFGPVWDS